MLQWFTSYNDTCCASCPLRLAHSSLADYPSPRIDTSHRYLAFYHLALYPRRISNAKQRCVMGVGVCLYAQLVQTKNKQCKSAIILQCYHLHLSDFCSRPQLTQPYNHIIYPGVAKIYIVFF